MTWGERHEIIVAGGGPARVTAALRARELGVSVVLVERGNMGGTCTNDGCVPMRVPAHADRLARDAEPFAARRIVRDLDPASPDQRASGRSGAAEWEHSERG